MLGYDNVISDFSYFAASKNGGSNYCCLLLNSLIKGHFVNLLSVGFFLNHKKIKVI